MTPLRVLGKCSLPDEITMLERLKQTLVSAREQARFIATSTGDEYTREKLAEIAGYCASNGVVSSYLIARAKEAQKEADAETGRVSLQEDLGRG